MSERYTKLFSLPENLYAETSPVVIAAGALLKDNATGKVLAQLKFRNITGKTIKALRVRITPLDTVGAPLGEAVSHQYLDLSARRNDEFGQKSPITLPDVATRAFSASVTEAIFADNSLWSGTDAPWEPLPAPAALDSVLRDRELEKQYCLKFGENCQYSPMEHKDLWYCACGALNTKGESRCHKCNNSLSAFLSLDMDALKAAKDERLAAEAKKAEEEKAAAEAAAKKNKKLAAIIIPIVAVVIAAAVLVTQVIIPGSRYNTAKALLDAGEYDAAIEAFEALGDYKDSAERAKEAKATQKEAENAAAYKEAEELFEAGKYEKAIAAFDILGDYKDSTERVNEVEEAKNAVAYAEAEGLFEEEDYEAAIEAFNALGNYKDSPDRSLEVRYAMAEAMLSEGDIASAIACFDALGDYMDASTRGLEIWNAMVAEGYLIGEWSGSWEYNGNAIDATIILEASSDYQKKIYINEELYSAVSNKYEVIDRSVYLYENSSKTWWTIYEFTGDGLENNDHLLTKVG